MMQHEFLWELGLEEIPSQYVLGIQDSLATLMTEALRQARIYAGAVAASATPRRLTVRGPVLDRQEAEQETIRGPLVSIAYDAANGEPTAALKGFCRRVGQEPDALRTVVEGAKTYLAAVLDKPQDSASVILPELIRRVFDAVVLPRSMRWGDEDWRFIRPVRWMSLWFDQTLLPGTIAGVPSTPVTYGNRTDHPGPIPYTGTREYELALETGGVMLSTPARHDAILLTGTELAAEIGAKVDWDPVLLDEVVNLVEWPTPFLGHFDADFLEVPAPVLVTAMKVHQRYFPLYDNQGRLLAAFIGVRNGVGEHLERVIAGNQKVLRARLADAQYFYQADLKERLEERLPRLRQVLFHARLGTYGEKIDRLSQFLASTRDWWKLGREEQQTLERVIRLYKTDLLTHVVQEFPELQGEMAAIYARLEGESPALVEAVGDQYRPLFSGDRIPSTPLGQWLGLMDRVDTLVMALGHGLKPTGSEDPFGIRRAALAVGRILLEGSSFLHNRPIREIIKEMALVANIRDIETIVEETYGLVAQRLTSYLEVQYPATLVRATLRADLPWSTVPQRISWLQELIQRPGWDAVGVVYKRIDRVLPQELIAAETSRTSYPLEIERALATTAEKLWRDSIAAEDWWEGALRVADLVNRLFDEVLVMDPDLTVRERRLALLARVRAGLSRYFDMGLVSTG